MMENSIPLIVSFVFLFLCILRAFLCRHGKGNLKLPPGPKPFPIVGNILQLTSKPPHRALADLSRSYGPLMSLKLGSVDALVVSSAEMAREIFVNHDLAFSSRQVPDAIRALNHDLHSMAWLPVSPLWRDLRKVASIQLFSGRRLEANHSLRDKKVRELVEFVGECCGNGQAVDIGRLGFTTALNLLSNTFFSVDLAGHGSSSSQEFKDIIWKIMESAGRPSLADYFPLLHYFDPRGIRRDTATHFSKLFAVFDDLVGKRLSIDPSDSCSYGDVLETLLRNYKQDGDHGLSLDDIKHLLLDFFAAGTDTTASTVEWAMTELLCNPTKMVKAQEEIGQVLDKNALVQESDIQSLPYLQAIVKETFRLHPPLPLLLPHKARDDVQLFNYRVPNNTQVLINLWAIGRDPKIWESPTEFLPERFLDRVDIDTKGTSFELIPFGAGRRICPGMPLAHRMVHVMLAALLHGFGWKLPNGMTRDQMDMNDKCGVTVQKAKPLLAVPIPM